LARCVLLLELPDHGEIKFLEKDLLSMSKNALKEMRKDMQIIFQDPYSSLNPRKKVYEAIGEPLLFHRLTEKKNVMERVLEILRRVGLDEDFLNKYPYEMSGGQRQRVAIGRALATNPALIVADEPVSSLDVSIQAQIVNLFMDLKDNVHFSMLFVSHDLNIVRFVADNIIVMYAGRIVEMGEKNEVFLRPLHPYTEMLISFIKGDFSERAGDDVFDSSAGCAYFPRCGRRQAACTKEIPELKGTKEHAVACIS
jgi:oligopeptide/dipeptide ABC transporter ATP-binding protein